LSILFVAFSGLGIRGATAWEIDIDVSYYYQLPALIFSTTRSPWRTYKTSVRSSSTKIKARSTIEDVDVSRRARPHRTLASFVLLLPDLSWHERLKALHELRLHDRSLSEIIVRESRLIESRIGVPALFYWFFV
jgi:hypothetical protein